MFHLTCLAALHSSSAKLSHGLEIACALIMGGCTVEELVGDIMPGKTDEVLTLK